MNGEGGKLIDLSMDSGLHEESMGRGKMDDGGDDDGSEQTRSDEISCDESERNDHQNEKIKRLESLLNKCKVHNLEGIDCRRVSSDQPNRCFPFSQQK